MHTFLYTHMFLRTLRTGETSVTSVYMHIRDIKVKQYILYFLIYAPYLIHIRVIRMGGGAVYQNTIKGLANQNLEEEKNPISE